MKIQRHITTGILAAAALLLAGSVRLQAVPNLVVAAFATGEQGQPSSANGGGQYGGDDIAVNYGAGTIVWDGVTYDAADGSTGAAYITVNFSSANNTELDVSVGPGYNNPYYEGGGNQPGTPWQATGTVDFTQYHAVQFDILWDNTSALTIPQFNTGDGWPTSDFVNPAVGPDYMATNSYYTDGVQVNLMTGSGGGTTYLGTFQVPAGAASGWQTVTVPYSDQLSGINSGAGIIFNGYFGGGGELVGNYNGSFWIDNLQLIGNLTVSGPPTMNPPTPAVPGLNIFNASVGTGSYPYSDRDEVIAKSTSGLSWVGHTPASYSFNMAGFPNGAAFTGEAYLFLIPNSTAEDNAADYNEASAMVLEVQSTATGAQASLSYKVNEPDSETYTAVTFTSFTGGPNPPVTAGTAVPTTKVTGNYTLTFTGNDAGTVTAPDGTTGAFTLPGTTAETYFTENGAANFPFIMYLGAQPNDISFINKSVVYQSITVTGPPNGAAASENFLADANAATPALQNWESTWTGNATTDPAANVLVPSTAPYWVSWSLPSSGFSLVDTSSLTQPIAWNSVSTFSPIPMYNIDQQLISQSDLQSPTADQYFALIHRTFSQLLVLLPGETSAPNTPTGKTGTPNSYSLSAGGGEAEVTATVLAVDSNWNPVGGITDQISISDSGGGIDPNNAALVNGSGQFTVTFLTTGSGITITAMDATSPSITQSISSPFDVNP